jgi:hypothetical protein
MRKGVPDTAADIMYASIKALARTRSVPQHVAHGHEATFRVTADQELTDERVSAQGNGSSSMRTTWRMYRTKEGQWVVYSGPLSFTAADRFEVEKRLAKYSCRPEDIERLFLSEADKGEGVVSVPIVFERLHEKLHAPTIMGSHGAYRWLTTGQHDLDSLLSYCPQALLGKYVAVTSLDSGPMVLTDAENHAGWSSRNEIVYSPQIQSTAECRTERTPGDCSGSTNGTSLIPVDLGLLCHGNIFESALTPGRVWTFVNYDAGFALHDPKMANITSLFWQQLHSIRPESFIADSDAFLTFVSLNDDIFVAVCNAMQRSGGCPAFS